MNQRLSNKRGITLIALIVTIILLLILAGITIASLNGENGLFEKVKLAKQKYSIAETKEKLELEIIELRLEIEGKGETLTKEHLPKINNDEIDVGSTESFPVEVIYGKYKFNVDDKFIVTYVGEADRTIITYITNPEGYTNQDEVEILIKVSNPNGIKTIEYPNGDIVNANGKTTIGIDYVVTANGTYTFNVVDKEDKEVIKDIVIDQIDKLAPIDFTPEVEKDGNNIIITSNAQDAESDGISTKSGIEYCKYYLKSEEETEYTKYETNKITGLATGKYELYVIAYDRAGNKKISTIIDIEIKIIIKMTSIDSSYYHCLGIDDKGNMYSWGMNDYGQLGYEMEGVNSNLIISKIPTYNISFLQIAAGEYHSLAIDKEGNIWSWGRNDYGQLGNGMTIDLNVPTKISVKEVENVVFSKIFAGDYYSLAIDNEGNIWSWGRNNYGQLGNGTTIDSNIPIKISLNEGVQFTKISAGEGHNLAIDLEGTLWSWGYNNCGQLGNGDKTNRIVPSKIQLNNDKKIIDISADALQSFAIDIEGNILAWGNNQNGQLGNGKEKTTQAEPIQITSGTVFCRIEAGETHGKALDTEGNVWSWGKGSFGELGNGATTKKLYPSKVQCNTIFKNIYGNTHVNFAIDEEDNLWSWGYGLYGQLGNGMTSSVLVPTMIP